jgi:hypothetical protein
MYNMFQANNLLILTRNDDLFENLDGLARAQALHAHLPASHQPPARIHSSSYPANVQS